tara:strand:+ start:371 stop:664 length:294 start_codon:yes stop_codon:yes gene_type:complete
MSKVKKKNLTKKDISQKIFSSIGVSQFYSNSITNDLILILKKILKIKPLNVKKFGTFKILKKKKRYGRNPKTKKEHIINARDSVSFIASKYLNEKIN